MNLLLVYVTCADAKEAGRLAEVLVSERLVACANQGHSVISTYLWEGRLERKEEIPLLFKTTREGFELLRKRIRELHSYTTPVIAAWEADETDPDYLRWVSAAVKTDP